MNIKEAVNTLHGLIDDIHFALSLNEDKEYVNSIYEMENTISEFVKNHEMLFVSGLTVTAFTNDELSIAEYVPVKHGRWEYKGEQKGYFCSVCHSEYLLNIESGWHLSKYCPHCGAYMDTIEQVIGEGHSETKVWEVK